MLLHMLGHGLTKSVLFSASGTLLREEGTTNISAVRGVLARRPVLGTCFALGLASLLGFPPFSIFASELGVLRAGISGGPALPTLAALVLLLVVFGALTIHGVSILLGPPPPSETAAISISTIQGTVDAGIANRWLTDAPLVAGLGVVAVLGVTLGPLHQLLTAAATIVAGTR